MNAMHTTCPSCHAVFRVKPEQLEAHAGKVRCGKCAYVFNGFETLITPIETVSFMAPYDEDEDDEEIAVEKIAEEKAEAKQFEAEQAHIEARPETETVEVYDVRPMTITESVSGSFPLQTDEQIAREAEEINRVIAANAHPDLIEEGDKSAQEKTGLKITPELHAKLNNLQQQLTQQESHARWHFWGWGLGLLVLTLVLAGQSIYFFRNTVAAFYPEAKPLLSSACKLLGCKIELMTNIGLIKLDGAELQAMPDKPNIVIFSATMRNSAAYRQAYPKLELTLTDLTNHALARRYFAPSEYLPQGMKIDAGLPVQDEVPVKLTLDLDRLEAVGYKSRLFYP